MHSPPTKKLPLMLSCTMGRHQILCFLFLLHSSLPFAFPLCSPDQRDALLHFENSFVLNMPVLNSTDPPVDPREGSSWSKSVDCCSWSRVTCDNVTGNVIGLNLTNIRFHGALYSNGSLLLPKLGVLEMSGCNLTKFPYFLNSLETLTYLDLSNNKISGEVPRWFWGISRQTLEHLDLSANFLEGGIHQLHWKRLSYIDLQNNSFQGPLPIPSPSTSYFSANNNRFAGEIPTSICQLSSLLTLDLSNNNLSRNMPSCFCDITKLLRLDLSNNSLSGNIPPCFGNITNLEHLDLSRNELQGSLPRSLVKCTNLLKLVLSHNEFSDVFPHWLEAPRLSLLDLESNKFQGRIDLAMFRISFPTLMYLSIPKNNFTGQLPTDVFFNTTLKVINLSSNRFGGPIPLPSPVTVDYLISSNNMIGKIPSFLCNFTHLERIDLSNNSLTGSLPKCLTSFSSLLSILNLRMNQLEGTIPQSVPSVCALVILDLSQNRFEGRLPRSLVKCSKLEILDLNGNQIEDSFPRWLGKIPELKVLILRSNHFKGHLNITNGDPLFPKLRILDLSNNKFGGPLPANLIMNLKGMMSGEAKQEGVYMSLTCAMDSYGNSVTVVMKGQETFLVKILTILTAIDLSQNSFQGDIPEAIGHLHSLVGLNLSCNHLTGSIPSNIGNLTNLGWLDLSSNMLSGRIPRKLGDLAALGFLNLSKNQLDGRIPQDKQLSTFSIDSFRGNPDLCGTPLPKSCTDDAQPPPPSSSPIFDHEMQESWFKHKAVWLGYASGMVIGISTAYIALETGRPKWLARVVWMLERRATNLREKKRKAIKFHG